MASMGSVGKFEISRFNGTCNFALWQRRVKDLLTRQGMLKALKEKKPDSLKDDEWEEMQEKAASMIQLFLTNEVIYHVIDLKSSQEIWTQLEKRYMSKSLSSKLYLKQRLYGLKMVESSDLMKHVNIFNQVIEDLARAVVMLEDEDKAMILMCSLPSSYENLVMTLTCGKDEISLDMVSTTLLSMAERRQHTDESSQSEGLYVKGNQDRGGTKEKQEGGNK